jgi:hypothetical protein
LYSSAKLKGLNPGDPAISGRYLPLDSGAYLWKPLGVFTYIYMYARRPRQPEPPTASKCRYLFQPPYADTTSWSNYLPLLDAGYDPVRLQFPAILCRRPDRLGVHEQNECFACAVSTPLCAGNKGELKMPLHVMTEQQPSVLAWSPEVTMRQVASERVAQPSFV